MKRKQKKYDSKFSGKKEKTQQLLSKKTIVILWKWNKKESDADEP